MFPNLTNLIEMLAEDNDGNTSQLKPQNEWIWPDNSSTLEKQASKLPSDNERWVFVAGEQTEQDALVRRLQIQDLSDWLTEVFDGELHDNFYRN